MRSTRTRTFRLLLISTCTAAAALLFAPIEARAQSCSSGYGLCPDGGRCCPTGTLCCPNGGCCPSDKPWCGNDGYCYTCSNPPCGSTGNSGSTGNCGGNATATQATCGGDSCSCASFCSSHSDCASGCCSDGTCALPCVCRGEGYDYLCGNDSDGSYDYSGSSGCSSTTGPSLAGVMVAAALGLLLRRRRSPDRLDRSVSGALGLVVSALVLGAACGQPIAEGTTEAGAIGSVSKPLAEAPCARPEVDPQAVGSPGGNVQPLPNAVSAWMKSNPATRVAVVRGQATDDVAVTAPVFDVLPREGDRVLQVPAVPARP